MSYTLRIKRIRDVPFQFESGVSVEESKQKSTVIKGVLLSEGISGNGNLYTVEEMKDIAKQAFGIPLYYGVDWLNRHAKGEPIGKIVKAKFDSVAKKIIFWAKITNQKIAESVQKGWKVSIGGSAKFVQYMLTNLGKIVMRLKGITLEHLQLFEPHVKAGVSDAQVEQVIEESMRFDDKRILSNNQLTAIITALQINGELK